MSPGFFDVFAIWDSHHLNNAEKVCVPLLCLLADMVLFSPENITDAESFIHLQLDGLARNIIQHRMRAIYTHLSSGIRVRQNCALALCTSIVARNRSLAFELYRNFDFSMPSLNKLAVPRSVARSQQYVSSNRLQKPWAWMDPSMLPTRHMFVHFVLTFLEGRDKTLLRPLLAQKALLGNVMRHVASDPRHLICRTLRLFWKTVVCTEGRVPFRLRAALCGDCSLEQLTVICGSSNDRHAGSGKSEEQLEARKEIHTSVLIAAGLAQDIIIKICTDPSIGVCPQITLRKQGIGSGLNTTQMITMAKQNNTTNWKVDVKETVAGPNDHADMKHFGTHTKTKGDDKKAAAMLRLLRKLRPVESPNHAELLLKVCAIFPQIASMYMRDASASMEPRPSVSWLTAASHMGKIALAASKETITLPHHSVIQKQEGMPFLHVILPPCLDKAMLTRGMQHESGLVRHATLSLLLHVIRALQTRIANLEESIEIMAVQKGEHIATYRAFIACMRRDAVSALPDPRMFSAKYATRSSIASVETVCTVEKQKDSRATEYGIHDRIIGNVAALSLKTKATGHMNKMVLRRTHTINALAEYVDFVGVNRLAKANLDLTKCHLISPLSKPPTELAARIRLISAFYNIQKHGAQYFDSPQDSMAAESMAAKLCNEPCSDATGHSIKMGQGQLYDLLSVAACTKIKRVRREAMYLAAAHLQVCGGFENSEPFGQETWIWLRHLPARPLAVANTVCLFLADAISALERSQRGSYGRELTSNHDRTISSKTPRKSGVSAGKGFECSIFEEEDVNEDISRQIDNPNRHLGSLCLNPLVSLTLTMSLKVLQSPNKPRIHRLAIAAYVSSVLFDLLPRQENPLPMAVFVLGTISSFRESFKLNHVAQFPSLDSLAFFTKELIKYTKNGKQNYPFGIHDHNDKAGTFMSGLRKDCCDATSVRSKAADLLSQTAFHDYDDNRLALVFEQFMSASRPVLATAIELLPKNDYRKEIAGLAINAHGPLLPVALLLSVHKSHHLVPFSALIGAAVGPDHLVIPSLGEVAISTFKEVCYYVIKQIPVNELPSAARILKLWCNIAVANSTRQLKYDSSVPKITQNMRTDQNRHRSWSVFCVSAALHDRVNALVASFPLVAASTRRILLDLSAFSEGCFSSNYFLLAAYVNLVVMDYTNHYEVVPGCETKSIIDRAARIVGNFIAGKCDRGATQALFFIHLLRKAGSAEQKNIIASIDAMSSITDGTDRLACVLAVETISAMLPEISLSMSDNKLSIVDSHVLLSRALSIVLELDMSKDFSKDLEGTIIRACQVAISALATVKLSTSAAIIFSEPSTLPAVHGIIQRAIATPKSPLMRLACALTSVSTAYLDELISVLTTEIERNRGPSANIALLFPLMRNIVENHCAFCGSNLENYTHENSPMVSKDLQFISRAFRQLALEYFKGNLSSLKSEDDAFVFGTTDAILHEAVRPHAAIVLAATHAITPYDDVTRCAQINIIMPLTGWCFTEVNSTSRFSAEKAHLLGQFLAERANVARMMARMNGLMDAGTRRTYLTCLISTLRMLMLISIPDAENGLLSFINRAPSGINARSIQIQLIEDVQYVLAMSVNDTVHFRPSFVPAVHALARAIFCRRFASALSLSFFRHLIDYLHTPAEDFVTSRTDAVTIQAMKLVLSTFAQDVFERVVSHSATSGILMGNHDEELTTDVERASTSADTFLSLAMCDGYERYGDALEEIAPPKLNTNLLTAYTTSKFRLPHERLKLQLIKLMRSLWSMQLAAGVSKVGDSVRTAGDAGCGATHVTSHTSQTVWRARQARIIPLLAAAHDASMTPFDRHASAMLVSLDVASGRGKLAELGYLWGSAAEHFSRSRAAWQGPGARNLELSRNGYAQLDNIEHTKTQADSIASALRATGFPDPRRCAISALHFACWHHLFSCKSISNLNQVGQPVSKSATGYNPAWVLPFALRALKSRAVELRDCVAWGLISLALAATSSTDEHIRCVAYAVISAAADAANTGRPFQERTQLVALFSIFQNTITKQEPLQRISAITAMFAAETAFMSLHPANEIYIPLQRAMIRRATLDTESFPVGFLNFLNGGVVRDDSTVSRNNSRMIRIWLLRLLISSLSDASDTHLFRKSFAIEVLMSHMFAALFTDPYAKNLVFHVVTKAAHVSLMTKPLIEGSALIPWLAATAKNACHPTCLSTKNSNISAANAAAVTTALTEVVSVRGAIYGGPTGTAADSLAALRIIRMICLSSITAEHNHLYLKGNANSSAFCAMLLPALKFHASLAKQLSNRRVEVFDVSELMELCMAVDSVDKMSSDPKLADMVNSTVLDIIVNTLGVMRKDILVAGPVRAMQTTIAIAKSILTIVKWTATAVTRGGDRFLMQDYASIILRWASSFLLSEKEMISQFVDPDGGVGAAEVALSLGSLHHTAGPRHYHATIFELVCAQAELLHVLSQRSRRFPFLVSEKDQHVCAAMSTPVYTVLLSHGGALEELISEVKSEHFKAATSISAMTVKSCSRDMEVHRSQYMKGTIIQQDGRVDPNDTPTVLNDLDIQGNVRGKRMTAANLAANILQAIFTAVPPMVFLERMKQVIIPRNSSNGSAKESHQFQFDKHLEGLNFSQNVVSPQSRSSDHDHSGFFVG